MVKAGGSRGRRAWLAPLLPALDALRDALASYAGYRQATAGIPPKADGKGRQATGFQVGVAPPDPARARPARTTAKHGIALDADWQESKHPRAKNGEFARASGEGSHEEGQPSSADSLVRDLIKRGRPATPRETQRISERIAFARFDSSPARIRSADRGLVYQGKALEGRVDSLTYHAAKRILRDGQWSWNTKPGQYAGDLRKVPLDPDCRLAVYTRRGEHFVAAFAPTVNVVPKARLGPKYKMLTAVIFSADRGTIVSGYQVDTESQVDMPGDRRWLK